MELRLGRLRGIAAIAAVMMALAVGTAGAAPVPPPSQPAQPRRGVPGGNGDCGIDVRAVRSASPVWVYEPTGSGRATMGGGRCSGPQRPAVFIAHGFGATDPASYAGLIEHLVSVGNVVVYPTYEVEDGERSTLEASHRAVDAGIRRAVRQTPRVDTRRVGWWGHSHGGGMVPYLVQRGAERGWGRRGLWLTNVAQAYTQLVGTGRIRVPAHTRAITVAFDADGFADNRLGNDVFNSLTLPQTHKRHVLLNTDAHGQPALLAEHSVPFSDEGQVDAFDFLLWRYADLLETCALTGRSCDADLSSVGVWSDGTPIVDALESPHPVDTGPAPVVLAECDAGFGPTLNARIDRCGPTHL